MINYKGPILDGKILIIITKGLFFPSSTASFTPGLTVWRGALAGGRAIPCCIAFRVTFEDLTKNLKFARRAPRAHIAQKCKNESPALNKRPLNDCLSKKCPAHYLSDLKTSVLKTHYFERNASEASISRVDIKAIRVILTENIVMKDFLETV